MKILQKALIWFLVVIFVAFAAVQFNDPDPLLWISVYLATAIFGISAMYLNWKFWLYSLAALVCLVWAIFQWPDQWEGIGDAMLTPNTEHAREALGLLICSTADLYFSLYVFRKQKQIDA